MLITQLKNLHKKFAINLKFIIQRAKIYYDKKRFEKKRFKDEKKAFLLKKNIKIIKKNDKLNHVKIESFKIIRNIKKTNYELKLPNNMKFRHSIFHVLLLKLTHLDTSKNIISNKYVESQKEYRIEKVLNTQLINEQFYFLIK